MPSDAAVPLRLCSTRNAGRRVALLFCAAGAVLGSQPLPARAGEASSHPTRAVTAATQAAPVASTAPAPAQAAADPMAVIQRRLAEKLGARGAALDPQSGVVLRVSARPAPSDAPGHSAAPRAAKAAAKAAAPAHWTYEGTGGPDDWGSLKPEFTACSTGKRQSPIDIREGIKVPLDPVQFDYQSAGFRVVDNGHTVQVNVASGSSIAVMGQRFELLQFHFHRPSEERIDGRQFDMVAHFVHKSLEGKLAVVAVLLERGSAQPLLQQVWANLPLEKGDEVKARGSLDLNQLLPADRSYFTYMGSLTTPPCSEGVLWMVLKQPVQVSPEQIGIFARLYPMNARPIQSASGRLIKESN